MKRMGSVVVMGVSMLLAACMAAAQDGPPGPRPEGERPALARRERLGPMGPRMTPVRMKELLAQLDLTSEQKEKIAALQKALEEKTEEQQKALAELRTKRQEAGQDQEKLAAVRKETAELVAKNEADRKKLMDDIMAVLTEEQKKKFEELQRPAPAVPAIVKIIEDKAEELKLTDEQKEAVKKLAEEYKPAESTPQQREAMEATRKKMRELRESGASQDEIRKAMEEMRANQIEETVKAEQQGREFMEKLAKILNEEQMKTVKEAAQAQAERRPRLEGGERGFRMRRQGDQPGGPSTTPNSSGSNAAD
jgi:Spy/CpxP family protein refolding chaperone